MLKPTHPSRSIPYTLNTHMHTHTHKLNAALTHTDTTQFLHTFTCVHVGRDMCVHVCTSVPTTHTHVHMYANTYSYMCVHTNNTHTNTRVHKHNVYTRLHICIQAQKLKNSINPLQAHKIHTTHRYTATLMDSPPWHTHTHTSDHAQQRTHSCSEGQPSAEQLPNTAHRATASTERGLRKDPFRTRTHPQYITHRQMTSSTHLCMYVHAQMLLTTCYICVCMHNISTHVRMYVCIYVRAYGHTVHRWVLLWQRRGNKRLCGVDRRLSPAASDLQWPNTCPKASEGTTGRTFHCAMINLHTLHD